MLERWRGEGRVGDLATPLVVTSTVAVQMLYVEDVLGPAWTFWVTQRTKP